MSNATPLWDEKYPDMDMRVVHYHVITAEDTETLEYDVQQASRNGWKLQGGVSIAFKPDGSMTLAQAMWRERRYVEIVDGQ